MSTRDSEIDEIGKNLIVSPTMSVQPAATDAPMDGMPAPAPAGIAHARRADPDTSHQAAARVELTETQASVLSVFRIIGPDRSLLDEELVLKYRDWERPCRMARQTDSGIRSRRAELARMGELVECGKAMMTTGGTGRLWRIKDGVVKESRAR